MGSEDYPNLKYLFLMIMVLSGLTAHSLTVTLKNGTVQEGDLSFENSSVCIITNKNISSTIQKKDIALVDGKEYTEGRNLQSFVQNLNPVQSIPQTPVTEKNATIDYSGKKLSIVLKNGMVFNGTVISDKGKFLLLNRDGAPVNIYKSTIARIDVEGETTVKSETNLPTDTAKIIHEEKIDKKPVVSISSFEDARDTAGSRGGGNFQNKNKPIIAEKQMTIKTVPVTSVNNNDTMKHEQVSSPVSSGKRDSATTSIQNPAITSTSYKVRQINSAQSIALPENVYIPAMSVNPDSKRIIVLKNGTTFKGKVLSENDRFISIDSDGTSLNILKKVIKTIDGESYKFFAAVKKVTTSQVSQPTEPRTRKTPYSGKRPRPSVPAHAELTTVMLIDSLKAPSWERRSRACRILGAMGEWAYSTVPSITVLLGDTALSRMYVPVWIDSSDVQNLLAPSLEAARALAYLGDDGYKALTNALSSRDFLVRRSAVFGMLEFTDGNSRSQEFYTMIKDSDASVRAVALGGFCTPSGEALLIDALKDDQTAVRCNAALLLGKMKSERAVQELENLFSDNRSLVRAHAVEAIGEIGSVHSSQKIIRLLEDPNFAVRQKSAEALGYLGDTSAIVPLTYALRDVNPDVRATAATSLSHFRDPRAIPSLYALLKDENNNVREKARISLRFHTELKQLIDGLSNQSPTVRENAAYVLWLLTGKDFGSDPEKWKRWYSEQGKKK